MAAGLLRRRRRSSTRCASATRPRSRWLLDTYHGSLHRTARIYVATDAHADEVVQETWMAVLRGHRRLRAALVAQDVALPDPHEHRPDPRREGVPHHPVLVRRGRARRRSRADLRRRPVPTADRHRLARPLGVVPARLGAPAGVTICWPARRSTWSAAPSNSFRPRNGRCSRCATSTAGRRSRSVTRSG